MTKIFFKELKLPKPKYFLNIKSKNVFMEGNHTGRVMVALEPILLKDMPDIVIVGRVIYNSNNVTKCLNNY